MTPTRPYPGHELTRRAVSRRAFLAASGLSFCGLGLSALATPGYPVSGVTGEPDDWASGMLYCKDRDGKLTAFRLHGAAP